MISFIHSFISLRHPKCSARNVAYLTALSLSYASMHCMYAAHGHRTLSPCESYMHRSVRECKRCQICKVLWTALRVSPSKARCGEICSPRADLRYFRMPAVPFVPDVSETAANGKKSGCIIIATAPAPTTGCHRK